MKPIVREHDGILVVRDDLYVGGTKARFFPEIFAGVDEVVYASPAEGGAQFALATIGKAIGKRVTIFVAKRGSPHPRAFEAKRLGAKVVQVTPGYLSVVQARAKAYAVAVGARLVPFGADLPEAGSVIGAAARATGLDPAEVWCAGGSGVLARALKAAWPQARLSVVQVGRTLELPGAAVHVYPRAFGAEGRIKPPFPSDPHYDAKAWEFCAGAPRKAVEPTVFWNVTSPAQP